MELNGFVGVVYNFCVVFVRLAYLNLLWVLFTIVGFGVLGIMPATVAMFSVSRKWINGDTEIPVFRIFFKAFKKEFVKSNILGVFLVLAGLLIYQSTVFLEAANHFIFQALYFGFFGIVLLFAITLLYTFPVLAHYEIKVTNVFKNAFLIGIANPIHSLMMVVGSILTIVVLSLIGLVPFFIGSSLSFLIMWVANRSFTKMENRLQVN